MFHRASLIFHKLVNMNIFRLAGDMTHLLSIMVLLLKIHATRSCRGVGRAPVADLLLHGLFKQPHCIAVLIDSLEVIGPGACVLDVRVMAS